MLAHGTFNRIATDFISRFSQYAQDPTQEDNFFAFIDQNIFALLEIATKKSGREVNSRLEHAILDSYWCAILKGERPEIAVLLGVPVPVEPQRHLRAYALVKGYYFHQQANNWLSQNNLDKADRYISLALYANNFAALQSELVMACHELDRLQEQGGSLNQLHDVLTTAFECSGQLMQRHATPGYIEAAIFYFRLMSYHIDVTKNPASISSCGTLVLQCLYKAKENLKYSAAEIHNHCHDEPRICLQKRGQNLTVNQAIEKITALFREKSILPTHELQAIEGNLVAQRSCGFANHKFK